MKLTLRNGFFAFFSIITIGLLIQCSKSDEAGGEVAGGEVTATEATVSAATASALNDSLQDVLDDLGGAFSGGALMKADEVDPEAEGDDSSDESAEGSDGDGDSVDSAGHGGEGMGDLGCPSDAKEVGGGCQFDCPGGGTVTFSLPGDPPSQFCGSSGVETVSESFEFTMSFEGCVQSVKDENCEEDQATLTGDVTGAGTLFEICGSDGSPGAATHTFALKTGEEDLTVDEDIVAIDITVTNERLEGGCDFKEDFSGTITINGTSNEFTGFEQVGEAMGESCYAEDHGHGSADASLALGDDDDNETDGDFEGDDSDDDDNETDGGSEGDDSTEGDDATMDGGSEEQSCSATSPAVNDECSDCIETCHDEAGFPDAPPEFGSAEDEAFLACLKACHEDGSICPTFEEFQDQQGDQDGTEENQGDDSTEGGSTEGGSEGGDYPSMEEPTPCDEDEDICESDHVCADFEGSKYCTMACDEDEDCPDELTCGEDNGCVPDFAGGNPGEELL